MHTGPKGLALIKRFEGWRSNAYKDVAGIWTIGYGHTSQAGPPAVKAGMKITKAEGEAMLKRDLLKYENAVNSAVKVDLAQEQFDALVSLCYNIGPGNFRKSSVLKAVNKRDWKTAARRFALWNKARVKGKLVVVSGLVRRRGEEAALFAEAQPDLNLALSSGHVIDLDAGEYAEIEQDTGTPMWKSKTSLAGMAQAAGGAAIVSTSVAETKSNLEVISDGVDWAQIALYGMAALGALALVSGLWFLYDRRRKAKEDAV